MAIKGKAKRSRGRAVRRVTPGPRPVPVQRPTPWYRTGVFMVAVALAALAVTVVTAVNRVQHAWARDDVERFTTMVDRPLDRVATIIGAGSSDKPGFDSAQELTSGGLKPDELDRRAQNWHTELSGLRQELAAVRVGEADIVARDNIPPNDVGGRLAVLSGIRETYTAGVGILERAAELYQQAARAPEAQRQEALNTAQSVAQSGQHVLDSAAESLALLRAELGLPVDMQLPGESATSYELRTSGQLQIPGLPPVDVEG